MTTRVAVRPRLCLSVLALAAAAWWTYFRVSSGIVLEDALITFRYADMLAAGNGPVFNEGERVLAATNALYALVLAVPSWIFGPGSLPIAAPAIGIACTLLAGLLLVASMRRCSLSWTACLVAAGFVWFHPGVTWASVGGMETGMVLALMSLSLWALVTDRPVCVALAAAALVMTRPDGLVWVVLVIAVALVLKRRGAIKTAVLCASLLGAWWLLLFTYYGHALPHSVLAKQVIGQAEPDVGLFQRLVTYSLWMFRGTAVGSIGGPWTYVAWMSIALGVLGGGALFVDPNRRPLTLLALFPFALGAAYFVGKAPREFDWYPVPAGFVWSACTAVALALVAARRHRLTSFGAIGLTVVFAISIARGNLHALHRCTNYQKAEDSLRRPVGEWLAKNTPESATVAMEAIGYQGYYSRRRVIDFAGLVSPHVVRAHQEHDSNAEAFCAVLAELKPDFLVLRSFEVDENRSFHGGPLFPSERARLDFEASYRELRRFAIEGPNNWGALGRLTVFERLNSK